MDQPEIESSHLDAVKNLRSRFEQLAHNEPPSLSSHRLSTMSTSSSTSSLLVPEPTTPTRPRATSSGDTSSNSTSHHLRSTSSTSDLKGAGTTVRRPPPPPPTSSSRAPSPAPSITSLPSPRGSPMLRPVNSPSMLASPGLRSASGPVPPLTVSSSDQDGEVQTPTAGVAALRNRFLSNQTSPSLSPLLPTSPSSSNKAIGKLNLNSLHHAHSDSTVPTQTHPHLSTKPPVPSRPSKLNAIPHSSPPNAFSAPASPAPLIDFVTNLEDTRQLAPRLPPPRIQTHAHTRTSLPKSNADADDPFGDSDSTSSLESPTVVHASPASTKTGTKTKAPALPARKANPNNNSNPSLVNVSNVSGHKPSLSSSSSRTSSTSESDVFSPVPSNSSSRSSSSLLPPPRHPETPTLSLSPSPIPSFSATPPSSSSTATPGSSSSGTTPPLLPSRPPLPARRATATQVEDILLPSLSSSLPPKLPQRADTSEIPSKPPPPPLATHPSLSGTALYTTNNSSSVVGVTAESPSSVTPATELERKPLGGGKHLPPPTRTIALGDKLPPVRKNNNQGTATTTTGTNGDEDGPVNPQDSEDDEYDDDYDDEEGGGGGGGGGGAGSWAGGKGKGKAGGPGGFLDQLPDATNSSRRPPWLFSSASPGPSSLYSSSSLSFLKYPGPGAGLGRIQVQAYTAACVLVSNYIVVGNGHHVRVFDLGYSVDVPRWDVDTREIGVKDGKVGAMEVRYMGSTPAGGAGGGGGSLKGKGKGKAVSDGGGGGEGPYLWVGLHQGHIFEIDASCGVITGVRHSAHLHPIIYLFKYGASMISIDESGKMLIWGTPAGSGAEGRGGGGVPGSLLSTTPRVMRITEKLDFCKLMGGGCLWTAARSEVHGAGTTSKTPIIRIYDLFPSHTAVPGAGTRSGHAPPGSVAGPIGVGKSVMPYDHVGPVTCATIVSTMEGYVFMGHEEGYITIWDVGGGGRSPYSSSSLDNLGAELPTTYSFAYPKCVEILKISGSDIISMEGVSSRLWIGARSGSISIYDPSVKPWITTTSWIAHPGLPVMKLAVDPFGISSLGRLGVLSVGRDQRIAVWDGLLSQDWVDEELVRNEAKYSNLRDLKILMISWNCDSAKPETLSGSMSGHGLGGGYGGSSGGEPRNFNFLADVLKSVDSPDIISFGFQEVIDLESRRVAAKNVVFGRGDKKKDREMGFSGYVIGSSHHVEFFEEGSQGALLGLSDKVSGAYRRWYDALALAIRLAMPPEQPYSVVFTQSLVGLFSCMFIKHNERSCLRDLAITTVKRGMGGRYGNKVRGIVTRFILQDTSLCFINCHLAAGQHAIRQRNSDIASMLEEKQVFPMAIEPTAYVGGGDGSMVLDHEMVFINGDMNYRIDQRRDAIIAAVRAGEPETMLPHDQLKKEIKYNRGCRLRSFTEGPINFAPTYKYDQRSDEYDTSEKRRAPAWCDRVLWKARAPERVEQLQYRRWEVNVSDHRPISAVFKTTVKNVRHEVRQGVKQEIQMRWAEEQNRILTETKEFYMRQMRL
ncbi:hypothetical protein K435DRAFT_784147 [Dendrothele bispora CBS 962.96]|uniref:Inositol polyphosphate-related phosphatase domain-containing protein n=1 Tax=Dendrothele bispora (strain CBS 962.96) TaxID=1314807 RepID=A0A4S8L4M8_DENBC|nr:hypothetical protein K435DRAFT_784147 [Dendrothele bispora CBS 962.96]